MSNVRHDRAILVRSFGVSYPSACTLKPPRDPAWHQLIYATQGAVTVRTGAAAWVAPPHRAVWVPAGVTFDLRFAGPVALRSLYFPKRRRLAALPRACAVMNVTPLLRELIVRTIEHGALHRRDAAHRRLAALIFDEVERLHTIPLQLPLPDDARAVAFARLWQASATPVASKALLRKCGASRRTLERLFHAETGMSLGQWIRRERLLRALPLLAASQPVATVAGELGYSSPSAFIAMFRRELGATPGHYFHA
jgi:AraC-like DNA-binding protein